MSMTIDDINKDILLDVIEEIKYESGYNTVILATGTESLKDIDILYGYKVLNIDGVYNDNETLDDKLFIIPYNSGSCKFKMSDSECDGYEIVFDDEDQEV